MAKRIVEAFDCDMCGKDGQRYSVTFPDGKTKLLDRCPTHASRIESLRETPGTWHEEANMRRYHKTDIEAIRKVMKRV